MSQIPNTQTRRFGSCLLPRSGEAGLWITRKSPRKSMTQIGLEQGWATWDTRHSLLSQFFIIIFPHQCLFTVQNMCIYTHTWLRTDYMNYRFHQISLQWNIWTQIRSGATCWLDIYHWGAGLAVTGRIRDIVRNGLQSAFEQEAAAATVTAMFCFYCIPRGGINTNNYSAH